VNEMNLCAVEHVLSSHKNNFPSPNLFTIFFQKNVTTYQSLVPEILEHHD